MCEFTAKVMIFSLKFFIFASQTDSRDDKNGQIN